MLHSNERNVNIETTNIDTNGLDLVEVSLPAFVWRYQIKLLRISNKRYQFRAEYLPSAKIKCYAMISCSGSSLDLLANMETVKQFLLIYSSLSIRFYWLTTILFSLSIQIIMRSIYEIKCPWASEDAVVFAISSS
jgi:hypothetical protein